jgi:beta-lactam-binding protein with PASTA domain
MSLKEFFLSKVFLKNLALGLTFAAGALILLLLWLNVYTRHGQARAIPSFIGMNEFSVDSLARKSKLKYQFIDSVYTALVPRGCVAEQNPKPGFRVKKWRNVSLTINAYRPEMVAMPNLVDLPLRQALALLESSGLVMGTKRYKSDLSMNIVLNQLYNGIEVAEKDSLQKGSVIDLVLGKGLSNQRTSVPNLIGLNLDPARKRILGTSLNLGTYIYDNTIRSGDDSLKAFVYKQNPNYEDEATLQFGSAIYLWLTVDSLKLPVDSTMISVPDTLTPSGSASGTVN